MANGTSEGKGDLGGQRRRGAQVTGEGGEKWLDSASLRLQGRPWRSGLGSGAPSGTPVTPRWDSGGKGRERDPCGRLSKRGQRGTGRKPGGHATPGPGRVRADSRGPTGTPTLHPETWGGGGGNQPCGGTEPRGGLSSPCPTPAPPPPGPPGPPRAWGVGGPQPADSEKRPSQLDHHQPHPRKGSGDQLHTQIFHLLASTCLHPRKATRGSKHKVGGEKRGEGEGRKPNSQ